MPKKKNYVLLYCSDCRAETLTTYVKGHAYYFCSLCGENMDVRVVDKLWIDKLFYRKKHWTDDEDTALIYGYNKGLSWKDIADGLMYRSPQAVRRRAQQLQEKGVLS
ncbi:SANT/Myb-like DNA-binding domain-containing protein [Alteribacillus persepolensis]|uniref:SANT/Myb-like DNA-binding domain-containing protein n=1 Tax=Alteribacillus persepolensis TaxID=568899 RepID=UPI000B83EDC9|nr:SANT/Myb-like DNA-binding domain-containing protein [Alteribacillus persepolensis]